jgi:hypothetical protein
MWRRSLSNELTPMDKGNDEERARLRSMNQRSYDDMMWIISLLLEVGACVTSTLEDLKWNAQGKCKFVEYFISPV